MGTMEKKKATREEIERRAYEIYLERGGRDGSDIEDWVVAERELMEGSREPARQPVGAGVSGSRTTGGSGSRAEFERSLERLSKGRSGN